MLAFNTAKLAELPNSVAIFALVAVRFVKTAVSALMKVENRLVDEELVIVPLVDDRLVLEIFATERLVEVELVIVPFVEVKLESETAPAFKLVMVALVNVAFPAAISTLEILVFAKLVVPVAFKFVVLSVPSCDV